MNPENQYNIMMTSLLSKQKPTLRDNEKIVPDTESELIAPTPGGILPYLYILYFLAYLLTVSIERSNTLRSTCISGMQGSLKPIWLCL